jgi:2-amino-4-hydroxy-6-hydroxymethyldihydropteridine diphosphokinase
MTPSVPVFLALGTNLGEREANLAQARKEISSVSSIQKESSIYETPPWGVIDQPAFLNQVLAAETSLSPVELLAAVKEIEAKMGRVPSVRYGPRLIDIDILLYGNTVLNTPTLTLPHPRMAERAFVLVPLLEIVPDQVSPVSGERLVALLTGLDQSGITKREKKNA